MVSQSIAQKAAPSSIGGPARREARAGDPFLWVKIPGESDGQCSRGTGGATDPARGDSTDPAAGLWFPDMALELVHNANPPLK